MKNISNHALLSELSRRLEAGRMAQEELRRWQRKPRRAKRKTPSRRILSKPIMKFTDLDLKIRRALVERGNLVYFGDVAYKSENELRKIWNIGEIRAKRIRNWALRYV